MHSPTHPSSTALHAMRKEHEATNAAVKIAAVALWQLRMREPCDEDKYSMQMATWIKSVHPSWSPAALTRAHIPEAESWLTGAALARAVASVEAYTNSAAKKVGVSERTKPGDVADGTCLAVRSALALAHDLQVCDVEMNDLCEITNWFAAIRNAICHGNCTIVSGRKAKAKNAWGRIQTYFNFQDADQVPDFPDDSSVTWPLVVLASACSFRIAQTLDGAICLKYGSNW